jgi:hypothetical protein
LPARECGHDGVVAGVGAFGCDCHTEDSFVSRQVDEEFGAMEG